MQLPWLQIFMWTRAHRNEKDKLKFPPLSKKDKGHKQKFAKETLPINLQKYSMLVAAENENQRNNDSFFFKLLND